MNATQTPRPMMKKVFCFIVIFQLILFGHGVSAWAATLSPDLQAILPSLQPDDEISVIVTLSEKANLQLIRERERSLRRAEIIKALRAKADQTQRPVRSFLEGRRASKITSLWLINGLAVTGKASLIRELAGFPGVESIRREGVVRVSVPTVSQMAVPEWNLSLIRAPELWNVGVRGQGIVVANLDTGVDLDHPDLNPRWRGGTNSWFNPFSQFANRAECAIPNRCTPCESSSLLPCDSDGHGTLTTGVMVGGEAGGTAVGVAPEAIWIAAKIFNDAGEAPFGVIHQAFQWLLDPDGNPDTDDAPDLVNNSWGLDNINDCSLEFEPDIQVLRAAEIAVVFAGGNSGPAPFTSISPANNPGAFAVGAVDPSANVSSFSSRGPSACDGRIFPDLVAPGESIRTTDLTFGGRFPNSYAVVSGTSFAAPHVAGAMALLLSGFPNTTVSEVEGFLRQSALDRGPAGPDNDYGFGVLDVFEAFRAMLNPAQDISVSPLSHAFATTKEGRLSAAQRFTVSNLGLNLLVVTGVSIAGLNPADFIISNDTCSGQSIPSTGNCTVDVAFSPTSGGVKQATLSILSNDPDENPLGVPLDGTGIEQFSLTIVKTGTGTGTVTSSVAGIDCGPDCSEPFDPGTRIRLTAAADAGITLGGWSGCTFGFGSRCLVTMDTDKTITLLLLEPTITIVSPNGGEVWQAGSRQQVTWSFTGKPGPTVVVELLKGDIPHTIITTTRVGFRNGRTFNWLVPNTLPAGNDYKVRITSTSNNAHTDTSDQNFSITP